MTLESLIALFIVSAASILILNAHRSSQASAIAQSLVGDSRALVDELAAAASHDPCSVWHVDPSNSHQVEMSPPQCGHHAQYNDAGGRGTGSDIWGAHDQLVPDSVWGAWSTWLEGNTQELRIADWNSIRPLEHAATCDATDLRAARRVVIEWINPIGSATTPETVVYGPFISGDFGWGAAPRSGTSAGEVLEFTPVAASPPEFAGRSWPVIYDGQGCGVLAVPAGTHFTNSCVSATFTVAPGANANMLVELC